MLCIHLVGAQLMFGRERKEIKKEGRERRKTGEREGRSEGGREEGRSFFQWKVMTPS